MFECANVLNVMQIVQTSVHVRFGPYGFTLLDLLSDILTNLSMRGTIYFRASFTRLWGVAVPSCGNVARFHFAHRGNCLVRVDGVDEPIGLAQGDLVIIPHGTAHVLYCGQDPKNTILPLDTVLEASGFNGSGVLVYGGERDAWKDVAVFSLCFHLCKRGIEKLHRLDISPRPSQVWQSFDLKRKLLDRDVGDPRF